MQKLVLLASAEAAASLREHHLLRGVIAYRSTVAADGTVIMAFEPRHYHTRDELAKLPGVTVLPGAHDPAPIGDAHATALAHVQAKPTETMREIGLRLYAQHGPSFHPDS